MTSLKKVYQRIALVSIVALTYQFAGAQSAKITSTPVFEKPAELSIESIYFQEWYAGIEVGGTGFNVFVPIESENSDIVIDSVYFRNLKAKVVKKNGEYVALLENPSKLYTFKKAEKPEDYPFTLKDNECAITYTVNGQQKYFKVSNIKEYAGTYYKNGPNTLYTDVSDSRLAANK